MRGDLEKAATGLSAHLRQAAGDGWGFVGTGEGYLQVYIHASRLNWKHSIPPYWDDYKVLYDFDVPPIKKLKLSFESSQERERWIVDNADYFTVVRYQGPLRGYERHEVPTLAAAHATARKLLAGGGKPYMIYAVAGIYDCYVATVKPDSGG